MPSPGSHIAFGRKYEELRELTESGKLGDRVREWHEAMAKVERIAREEGGFKTAKWTYSWDHERDRLRRLPSFTLVASDARPQEQRVIKLPDHVRQRIERSNDRIGIAG